MQDRTFDRLTMKLAAQPTRRGFLGGLGAIAAAGFAATAFGQRRTFTQALARADDDPEEQVVLLFEEIGRIAHEHTGTCQALRKKTRDFEEKYHDQFESLRAEEATWSTDRRAAHADKYGERRLAVVEQVKAARSQCEIVSDEAGTEATPFATPLAATPASIGHPVTTRGFAQASATCTPDNYNFLPEAYCAKHDSDWTSPSFQWPAYCSSGNLDGSCDLCEDGVSGNSTLGGVCTHYWPQDCLGSDGQDLCDVKYHQTHSGIAGAICDRSDTSKIFTATSRCYSGDSDWHSPEFSWDLYCPKGYVDHDCVVCTEANGTSNPEICVKYWPQDCSRPSGNVCGVGFHVDDVEVCCHQGCPVATSDCVLSVFESVYGDPECGSCMLSWCGTTSSCVEHCTSESCCDEACSSDYVPEPPAGEGKTGGTPISLGTPTTAPVIPTTVPSTPATEPAIPTNIPPTEPPSTPLASPVD